MDYTQPRGEFGGSAMKLNCGPAPGLPDYLNLKPVDSAADAGAERLGRGLLGCAPGSEAFGGISFSEAVGLLRFRKNAIQKASAKALNRLLNAFYFNQIDAAAQDHLV